MHLSIIIGAWLLHGDVVRLDLVVTHIGLATSQTHVWTSVPIQLHILLVSILVQARTVALVAAHLDLGLEIGDLAAVVGISDLVVSSLHVCCSLDDWEPF